MLDNYENSNMPVTILSGIFPDKEMTRERRSSEYDISKDTRGVKRHVAPFSQPDELSTLLHGCGCAAEVCVISPAGTNFAISRRTRRG